MKVKQYKDKDWLYHQYIVLERSVRKIGNIFDIPKTTIGYWLQKHNIPRRSISESLMGEKNPLYGITDKNHHLYGKSRSEETKAKISASHIGIISSKETRAKMSVAKMGKNNPNFGGLSNEHRANLTASWTPKRKSKQSIIMTDRIFTEESRAKMSASAIGKIRSEESKAKQSKSITGENNHNWQGGKSFEPYGIEFNDELRNQIRNRDNYICQICGKTQEELGRKLDVHHIDYDKMNNRLENLISLCRSCHLQTNYNREDWIEYFRSIEKKERTGNKISSGR